MPNAAVISAELARQHGASADRLASKGSKATANSSINHRLNPNEKNADGEAPLAYALAIGDLEAAQMLIEAGADVNAVDALGLTALHAIVGMSEEYTHDGRQKEMFRLINQLALKGIAFGHQDRRGNTAINMLAQRAIARPIKGPAELYSQLGKHLLALDQSASETVQLRNNMGKGPLDYLNKNRNLLLWAAVHDKLPQVQEAIKAEVQHKKIEWEKLIALSKQMAL